MSKTVLLTSASVIVFSLSAYAEGNLETQFETGISIKTHASSLKELSETTIDLSHQEISLNEEVQKLPANVIVDFAKFSYSVDKKTGWEEGDKAIYNSLINDGWILDSFNGTTGTANIQIESVSGLLAFKDDHVVIATRGTEMTNWADWMTNFRFSRSPITRFFATDEANKLSAITAQFFGGIDGEVANGFLQTHLSSWDYIKAAILKRAQTLGKSTKDLHYTITGHSKGAAKAQLNALNLLTDSTLGVGVDYLEKSFILADSDVTDLGASGFYGMAIKSEPKNHGNVDTVVFESPRVFSDTTVKQVDKIVGKDNLVRVENKSENGIDSDPVIHVTPAMFGFAHAGTAVDVDSENFFVARHMMGNVGPQAIGAIEKHREMVAQKVAQAEVDSQAAAAIAKQTKTQAEVDPAASPSAKETASVTETKNSYFGQTIVEAVKYAGNTFASGFASAAQKAWGYFWN